MGLIQVSDEIFGMPFFTRSTPKFHTFCKVVQGDCDYRRSPTHHVLSWESLLFSIEIQAFHPVGARFLCLYQDTEHMSLNGDPRDVP